jgi:hypothetical protein
MACVVCLLAGLIVVILVLNHGTFSYTLDDAYIELSMSEQIRGGEYGVNSHEFCSPSSSILFPFLLAPLARSPIHPCLPLILNVAALLGAFEVLWRFLLRLGFDMDRRTEAVAATLLVIAVVALNLAGLVLTGMEHSLHVFLTATIVFLLIVAVEEGRLVAPLAVAVVLAPLVRYEALPLSLATLGVLGARGRWRIALASAAAIALLIGGFSAFLMTIGLPPLPSSVLVKSSVAVSGVEGGARQIASSMIENALGMGFHPVGLLLELTAVCAALLALRQGLRRTDGGRVALALVLVSVVAGHAAAGKFGWPERYEIYAVLTTLMLASYLAKEAIRRVLSAPGGRALVLLGGSALLIVGGSRYARATMLAPLGANNIYEQQYQMHRFLTEFHQGPACVNDLGWTSYRNDFEVVDLWGLGSERARALHQRDAGPKGYEDLARERGADLAIIYTDVLADNLPPGWVSLATMHLSRRLVTPASDRVDFYATDPARVQPLREELRAFAPTLPPGVRLEMH